MKKYILITLMVAGSCALIAFKLVSNKHTIEKKNQPVDYKNALIPVTAITVSKTLFNNTIIKSGTLAPLYEADIISSVPGKITAIAFEPGIHISKGAMLAKVDAGLKELSRISAHQQVEKLENDYKNYQELLAGDGTTQTKVNEIKLALDNAKNGEELLTKQISEYNIIAPLDGIIIGKNVVAGEFINAGTILGRLVDISKLKVSLMAAENEVYNIKMGRRLTIRTDIYPGQQFNARISFISPQGDDTHNFSVEAIMDNPVKFPLKAGSFVYADFAAEAAKQIIQIPGEALTGSAIDPSVYIYENGLAKIRHIRTGRSIAGNIEVVAGLNEGEQVIISGRINLQNDTPVQLVK